jgi:hypothetical protein
MSKCIMNIALINNDCLSVANTIEIVLSSSNYSDTDYISIVRFREDDILFLKSDYDKLNSLFVDKHERIKSISSNIENKISLQGVLF